MKQAKREQKERDQKKKKLFDDSVKYRNLLDLHKSSNMGPGEVGEHLDHIKDTESVGSHQRLNQ